MTESTDKVSQHIVRTIPHLPAQSLHISLWTDLQNAPFLRQQLVDGNREFEYAFLDAEMIISQSHLLAACFRALRDADSGRLKSQNIHSEIVFAMGMGNNIGEALRIFGIQTSTTALVVVKVFPSSSSGSRTEQEDSISSHLQAHISASPTPFIDEALTRLRNLTRLEKAYKISISISISTSTSTSKKGSGKRTKKAEGVPQEAIGVSSSTSGSAAISPLSGSGGKQDNDREGEVERVARLERVAIAAIALRGAG